MINPKCRKCGNELEENGAILSGPPFMDRRGPAFSPQEVTDKNHLCVKCYKLVMKFIDEDYEFPT